MTEKDVNYDALAARLTDPRNPLPTPTNVASGATAAEQGRAFLVREYGSEEALSHALRRGRPRVGYSATGESPTVRGRISDADFAAFKQLEAQTGKKQSELVREAVHLLLTQHKLAS